jgi:tRNA modification GTPase
MHRSSRYTLIVPIFDNDTICAVATPNGVGGIAVIRISGPQSFDISDRVLNHRQPCSNYDGYSLHRARVMDQQETVDDVLVSIFRSPKSFTGEDVVEVACHGGIIPVSRTISLLISAGCRSAEPGEFTRRAYMNGKLDLAQAEAVCDLINAKTEQAYRQAQSQHKGMLSDEVEVIRSLLLGVLARIEASIDFPEDVGELDVPFCSVELIRAQEKIEKLLSSADRGILLRRGAQVVLVGCPNVGKSSLMNLLLQHERAIVSDVPGTTRDTLEETLNLNGIAVRLWDTAGLRSTTDRVEAMGVERSHTAINNADLVVLVIDSSIGLCDEDKELINRIPGGRLLVVWNKSDLNSVGDLRVSARTGVGIRELEEAMTRRLLGDGTTQTEGDHAAVAHVHQRQALERSALSIVNAQQTIADGLPADFLSIDVRGSLSALGELTGQTANDDIINEIFYNFCFGK